MSSARNAILGDIRNTLSKRASDKDRADIVAKRLSEKPTGIIPKRGQVNLEERIKLFTEMATKVHTNVVRVKKYEDIPADISNYLREHNLPSSIKTGHDKRLSKAKWASHKNLTITKGASDGNDLVGVSHATTGIAETGTLLMESGQANPTTINFLADHHIVVISAKDIKGDMEASWSKLESKDGELVMPRVVNFITGPSRSGDIEQKLLLGAHGPRALRIIIVG
jgi:L-lactate dehydrogenase complex protein LldG